MSLLNSLIKEANKVPVIADKNAPMLLMIAGIGGLAATVISAVKATPMAIDKWMMRLQTDMKMERSNMRIFQCL